MKNTFNDELNQDIHGFNAGSDCKRFEHIFFYVKMCAEFKSDALMDRKWSKNGVFCV